RLRLFPRRRCPAGRSPQGQAGQDLPRRRGRPAGGRARLMDIPTLEREYAARGLRAVAGVDEVGRGPLAGPVVCAAVIMPLEEALRVPGVNDSKKLSPQKREQLAERIRAIARAYAVVEV